MGREAAVQIVKLVAKYHIVFVIRVPTQPGCWRCWRRDAAGFRAMRARPPIRSLPTGGPVSIRLIFGENVQAVNGWSRWFQADTLTTGSENAWCNTADRAGDVNAVWVQWAGQYGQFRAPRYLVLLVCRKVTSSSELMSTGLV